MKTLYVEVTYRTHMTQEEYDNLEECDNADGECQSKTVLFDVEEED